MGIVIDQIKCNGCGNCVSICPGNLIKLDRKGYAHLGRPSDCWSCLACMKACRHHAISFLLEPQLGGRGGRLTLEYTPLKTEWRIQLRGQGQQVFITDTKEANRY